MLVPGVIPFAMVTAYAACSLRDGAALHEALEEIVNSGSADDGDTGNVIKLSGNITLTAVSMNISKKKKNKAVTV